MCASGAVCWGTSILGSLAAIAIILTALGTIIGLVKPPDAAKYCGVIAGIVIVLILLVSVFVSLWSSMSVWARILLAAVALLILRIRQKRREPRRKNGED